MQSIPSNIQCNNGAKSIPGWNQHVKDYHAIARDAFLLWRDSGSPRQGPIFDLMRTSRAKFKYVFKICKNSESQMRANALADNLCNNNNKQFWKRVQSKKKSPLSSTIDGCNGQHDIANL